MEFFLGIFADLEPNTTFDMQQMFNEYFLAKTVLETYHTLQKNLFNLT